MLEKSLSYCLKALVRWIQVQCNVMAVLFTIGLTL